MPSPVMTTTNAAGNLFASASIAASGTTTFTVDVSAKFEVVIQIGVTYGTVATTSGLQIDIYRRIGSGATVDTNAFTSFVIPSVASTARTQSFALPVGRYTVKFTNTDATNGLTLVSATSDSTDAVT